MNIQGLKPCPFCGGNAIEVSPYDQKPLGSRWIIKCVDCGARIQGSHRAMNKAAWNQRVHEPRTGKWLEMGTNADGTHNIKCDQCGEGFKTKGHARSYYTKDKYKFCPHCGTDMGGKKSDD